MRYAIYSRSGVLEGFGHRTEPRMPAPRATRERLATRAMYLFEKRCHQSWSPYLWRPTTMAHLQSVARVVLRQEGSKRRVCVVSARGVDKHIHGRWVSVTWPLVDGSFWIELARDQRCLYILLHELAHVLSPQHWGDTPKTEHGPLDHGPAFARKYAWLLARYGYMMEEGDEPDGTFLRQMRHYGVRV